MARQTPNDRLVRLTEPFHFQRNRQIFNKQPRPPQAGIQPNQKRLVGWGGTTREYWDSLMKIYLKRNSGGV